MVELLAILFIRKLYPRKSFLESTISLTTVDPDKLVSFTKKFFGMRNPKVALKRFNDQPI